MLSMRLAVAVILLLAIQLASCASVPGVHVKGMSKGTPSADALIALDFVNALRQLNGAEPDLTTVSLASSKRADEFTLKMRDALQSSGYGTRWVDKDSTFFMFRYKKTTEMAAAATTREIYEIAVGALELRRGYARDTNRRVRPVTSLFIRGADASAVFLNDDIFSTKGSPSRRENRTDSNLSSAASTSTALRYVSSLKVPDEANPLDASVGKAAAGGQWKLPIAHMQRQQNVFDLGGSNYNNMLSSRSIVEKHVLTFANDSMRLGPLNKQRVEHLVKRFDPQTDVFSVIGCSMGPTRLRGGNSALALGRAGRVAEALRFAGVSDEYILDEGCWAGDGKLESLPSRGVVLALKRRVQ